MNKGKNSPNEVSVGIDRKNPTVILAASNTYWYYFSSDSGKSWKEYEQKSSLGVYGDPVILALPWGGFLYAHLSKTAGKEWGAWFDRIVVQKTIGLNKWNDGIGVGLNGTKMQDKPWISINSFSNVFQNRIYLSWTEFDQYGSTSTDHKSRILCSYSSDSAITFSHPVRVNDIDGDARDNDNTVEGANTASLIDGTLGIVWASENKIWFDKSVDGGNTFGEDKIIATQNAGWNIKIPYVQRANAFPFIQSDGNNFYVVYGDSMFGDHDIFLIRSEDAGNTFSSPIRVHNDKPGNEKDQFFSHFMVDQESGYIYIVYYDRRASSHNLFMELWVSISKDKGRTFNDYKLNNGIISPAGSDVFFGDYNGIDVYKGRASAVFTGLDEQGDLAVYNVCFKEEDLLTNSNNKNYFGGFFNNKDSLLYVHFYTEIKGETHLRLINEDGDEIKSFRFNCQSNLQNLLAEEKVKLNQNFKELYLVSEDKKIRIYRKIEKKK